MARKPREAAYTHDALRTHIPESGFVDYAKPPKQPTTTYAWDPRESPQLVWAGKAGLRRVEVDEEVSLDVPVVNLHIHERISAEGILRAVRREDAQRSLFADPELEFKDDIRYYEHQVGWSNRMILGDSLLVMNSLLEREGMKGQVQCIYMDPPYGIAYKSNFQPLISKPDGKPATDVRDGKDEDLTREVMQVQAFRDTWELGVHSYLTYLRDRLLLARELLKDEGSIFVQIGDQNVHRVRCLMDEVFGEENCIVTVTVKKKGSQKGSLLESISDSILFYAKDKEQVKYRQLYVPRPSSDEGQVSDQLTSGGLRKNQNYDYAIRGKTFRPAADNCWKILEEGMRRVEAADRILVGPGQIRFRKLDTDFGNLELTNLWDDTGAPSELCYSVQTADKIVARCILMTTDPGDLVLDPTCGSGTTAYVAEQWGRRWITMDTSRVALAIARHRLMTAAFDYYKLRHPTSGVSGGFVYKTVPHITLKSIAQNTEIDAIAAKHQPQIDEALARVNYEVQQSSRKHPEGWKEWEVPRTLDEWLPKSHGRTPADLLLQNGLDAFWQLKRAMQAEIDDSIKKNAPTEELVDQPEKERGIVRVTGPFSMEAVPNVGAEIGIEVADLGRMPIVEGALPMGMTLFEGGQPVLESVEARNVNAYVSDMIAKLAKTGVVAKGGKKLGFSALRAIEHAVLHAEGEIENGETRRVGVLFGPQNGSISESHVKDALAAGRRYDVLLLCGYDFTPTAQEMAQAASGGDWQVLLAYVAPDTVMTDLLKDTKASQLFTMIGEPDVVVYRHGDPSLPQLLANAASRGVTDVAARAEQMQPGELFLELKGVDLYDPLSGEVMSDAGQNVHALFVDQDYDGKSFCIGQALFPNKKDSWAKIAKNLKGAIDEDAFEAFRTLVCLPFKPGASFDREKGEGRVQVKVVDQRGNAVVKTIRP